LNIPYRKLSSALTREAPLFVFARRTGREKGPRWPQKRDQAPTSHAIHLSAADSMVAVTGSDERTRVSITAAYRSVGQQPLPAGQGDLLRVKLTYDVGRMEHATC